MTTIETDTNTLANIKIYCSARHISQKDFIKILCGRDKDFSNFIQKMKKLEV